MRALVSIFAGLLILISLYQLSFTWFVNQHEKEQGKKAEMYVKRTYPLTPQQKYPTNTEARAYYKDTVDNAHDAYLDSLLTATRDKKITWWGQTYQKAKESELLLGLDLQGGINVTMDIALDGLIKNGLANNPKDPQLLKAIGEAQRRKLNSDQNFIDLFASVYREQNPGTRLAPLFVNANNKLPGDASDSRVLNYIHDQANAAMKQTYQVLRKRIDKFGVAQPNINLDENKGIITVELAGASDPERVRKYLQSTANLQFWEVYTLEELSNSVMSASKALDEYMSATTVDTNGVAKKDTTTRNILVSKIKFIPPQQDQNTGKVSYSPSLGLSLLADTAAVNKYLAIPAVRNSFPSNLKFLWGKQDRDDDGKLSNFLRLYAIKTVPGKDKASLEGDAIEDARQEFDQVTNEVAVAMEMNPTGARNWATLTGKNVGKPIAIVLDDIVYSAPNVIQKIEGGHSRVTMGSGGKNQQLVVEEANDLANILKAGKLEAPAIIVQEQVVGPTLGAQAVNGGIMAFAIAFIVIFALMLVYYNTAGIVANIALILNLLFTIGVLSALNATLTAPGIAGLVLTIGMAVDTNVIIFERIKEELSKGNTYAQAVKTGYLRSLPPVLDAHITTMLTAIILFIYGLGPVLGFATTQILGILLSLFCGILVSRLITDFYTNKNRHFVYFTGLSKRIFKHAAFKFIQYRKVAYMISAVVLLLGVASFFHGFRYGVEFSGGRSYVVNFGKSVNAEEIRNSLEKTFGTTPTIKTYGGPDKLNITTDYRVSETGLTVDSAVQSTLYNGLKTFLPDGTTQQDFNNRLLEGSNKVNPTISDDLKKGAQWATFWSMLIIAIYIFIRFRDWRYSLGTIVALLHDVLVTMAVFSFLKDVVPFPLEIDQHFIAAILTVIGFSMNDTVIVYDRIREYSHTMHGADKTTILNKAINDTLSRTIMTSLTVFLTILILFLVGGEVTKGFAFAMLIGVITGTYSSIFVAAPILIDFAKDKPLGEAAPAPQKGSSTQKAVTNKA
ncbi:protein translocase subunit SecDF [Niastella yeongjuensis]|uniref:Multifunctional fusion protein n=1 Tax=Niastella yeongjuensis TaxID=354355 RepID=A0A1V9E0V2_9BACT|nr:protein translocase subunit SecDF [Niastella yeongjuensis]OQP39746.1 protein translocase subunit SecDF [Niastella yeongjuensis]SEO03869.1 SecD/SecF fusion protein [Niastella yeongjuensis]